MMTASVSGIFVEHAHHVDVLQTVDRVTTDTDSGRLAQTDFGQLGNSFVGQGAGAGNHADATLAVDVARHDADLDLIGG